jgi:Hydrazine synthase alpha subunit middle domain/WD40-like Beta Propeller Repeat
VNRSSENANRITIGACLRGLSLGLVTLLAACTQGPGGGGIGLASGQDPDPATVDFPLFYIRHQIPEKQDNVTRVRTFVKDDDYSATLWKRDRASPGAPEHELSARLRVDPMGKDDDRYDIKDLAVAPDGLKMAFAMRGPLKKNLKEDEPPTWNIWEYDLATDSLHRVITSDIIAEEGQDVAPAYLPDGRIMFSSTRQRQSKAILLDENKAQFEATNESKNESAFVLHVMNGDGTSIHQISFNPSSDLYSSVLQNGRVLFTRWDNSPGVGDGLHLYTSNPDGTDTQLHYGALSHDTGTDGLLNDSPIEFMRAREMSDGRLMVLTRERTDVDFGGNLVIINTKDYVENTQALAASAGMMGPAQIPATLNDVRTIPGPSPGGRFESGFPLWDGSGRILVSWSQCRLLDIGGTDPTRIIPCDATHLADPNVQTASPLYSVWMFTPAQNTILPVMPPVEGVMVTEAVVAQPRTPLPAVIVDKQAPVDLNPDLVAEGAGLLNIRSVYDIMGVDQARTASGTATSIANVSNPANAAYAQRLARFVRIVKPVSLPDDDDIADPDNSAFGPTGRMREIVAYAPVEPDGSVRMKVPANIAFQITLLDANGRSIGSEQSSWLSVRPGEVLSCTGCHVRTNANNATVMSHGRKGSFNAAYNGAAATGAAFPGAVNTISPEAGDTMAEARSRGGSSCIDTTTMTERCGLPSITPSADVIYNEIWKPAAAPTDSYAFGHMQLTTARPTNPFCYPVWTPTCRITIHYDTIATRPGHIHPLWTVPRPAAGVDDGAGNITFPQTCTYCHSRVSPADPAVVQLPAASLELTDEISDEDALQKRAYRELLFARPALELVMGAIQIRQVPLLDDMGNPVLDAAGNPVFTPVTLPAPMAVGNSRGSRFFSVMNNPTHQGMLSTAELRLLSEWLDIGAQYYNDPFPPTPQN